MDTLQLTVTDFSVSLVNYLSHSVVFYIVVFLCGLRMCYRMSVGKCNSDQDMAGKTVLITGATSGIGKATALELARRNARVLLGCRNLGKATKVVKEIVSTTGNSNVEVKLLDLCSFDSLRECAEDVIRTEKELHVLINNAGMGDSTLQITKDGCESVMQSNHLGHFLLTLLLLDLLKRSAPSRIINISSLLYVLGHLDPEDMRGDNIGYWARVTNGLYNRSKLANVLFTGELASRLEGTGVTVNTVHPGLVKTDILEGKKHLIYAQIMGAFMWLAGKSPMEGAQTSVYLAVHPEVERTTGKFFSNCKEKRLLGRAQDRKLAERLFTVSEEIVGTTFQSVSESGVK